MDTSAVIAASLTELHRIIRSRMGRKELPGNMNMHQMHVMVFIQERPSITMGELAKLLHVSQASATPLVAKLVRGGLVRRSIDRKNRKVVRVRLTPKGTAILKKAATQCNTQLRALFATIPDSDRAALAAILSRFVSTLHSS